MDIWVFTVVEALTLSLGIVCVNFWVSGSTYVQPKHILQSGSSSSLRSQSLCMRVPRIHTPTTNSRQIRAHLFAFSTLR